VAELVAEVRALRPPGVPHSFFGVDVVVAVLGRLVVADVVEDVELQLRPPVAGVGDPGALQVLLGLAGDVPRVASVRLPGHRVADVADQLQGRHFEDRVHGRCFRVGDQQHVALVDVLEAADARPVEPDPVLEQLVGEVFDGDREVLPDSRQVHEHEINDLDLRLLC
jgi:hypothetical protein